MGLSRVERERVNDSRLKIQSAADSLRNVSPGNIPEFEEIQTCLQDADKNLGRALRSSKSEAADADRR